MERQHSSKVSYVGSNPIRRASLRNKYCMNIGFYGHSNCAYSSPDSFLDIVANRLGANLVSKGVKQGSQERILFDLKKIGRASCRERV